jgi:hypothetical protein
MARKTMTPVREQVFLRKHPTRWLKLPIDVRMGLKKKRDEIVAIRAAIAERACVHTMPPVEIFDVAWMHDSAGVIHGRSGVVRFDGREMLGVQLPGASVLFADEAALRGILLHEFSHCFWHLQCALAHMAQGGGRTLDLSSPVENLNNPEADRERMVSPQDWFAPEDCAIFPYHNSKLLEQCTDEVALKWIAKGLPCLFPVAEFHAEHLTYPTDVAEKLAALMGVHHAP